MKISILYSFLWCVQSIFILISGNRISDDLNFLTEQQRNKYENLSQESKNFILEIKTTFEKKLNSTKAYVNFLCAAENIKTDCETFYPQFLDKVKKITQGVQRERSYFSRFMEGIKAEFGDIPDYLEKTIDDFGIMENLYHVPDNHSARRKITIYFYDICGYLSRFNDPIYNKYLTPQSLEYAATLGKKLFEPEYTDVQRKDVIVNFASFYARVRHGANVFYHDCRSVLGLKTKELEEMKKREVKLCELLDYMRLLKPWNFTKDDIHRMNLLAEAITPSRGQIYFDMTYKYDDTIYGQIEYGILPFVHAELNCPVWERVEN